MKLWNGEDWMVCCGNGRSLDELIRKKQTNRWRNEGLRERNGKDWNNSYYHGILDKQIFK